MRISRALALLVAAAAAAAEFDVIVVGATPAGIAASVTAARRNLRVALVEETDHIGGLTSGGLSNTDYRAFETLQGFFREFMRRVEEHYRREFGAESRQVKDCRQGTLYEPKVARAVFEQLLARQPSLRVFRRHRLEAALLGAAAGGRARLEGARFLARDSGNAVSISAPVLVDATYEGDLMAAAGAPYRLGRESRKEFGELFAGRIFFLDGRFLPGSTGEGDQRLQCYNFRLCMTNRPENRLLIERPAAYRREDYQPLLEAMRAGRLKTFVEGVVRIHSPLPNDKRDVNDHMQAPMSLRIMGASDNWPEGSPAERQRIFDLHKRHTLGLLYFLQNDPEVIETVRNEAREWGLAKDEFVESGNFPPVLYVREGRRLRGEFVFTEHDTQPVPGDVRSPLHADSVATGDYAIDCHGEGDPTPFHPNVYEGTFYFPSVPFQIPYAAMVPPNVDGLLVPVAVSATHIGFSAIRMEPTWAALGQAAGEAAALAVQQRLPVRQVPAAAIQERLWAANAITVYFSDVPPGSKWFALAQYFGTRGFFHGLPEMRRAPYQAYRPQPGQPRPPFPHHAAGMDLPIDEELARYWLRKSGVDSLPGYASGKWTRGQFLEYLRERMTSGR